MAAAAKADGVIRDAARVSPPAGRAPRQSVRPAPVHVPGASAREHGRHTARDRLAPVSPIAMPPAGAARRSNAGARAAAGGRARFSLRHLRGSRQPPSTRQGVAGGSTAGAAATRVSFATPAPLGPVTVPRRPPRDNAGSGAAAGAAAEPWRPRAGPRAGRFVRPRPPPQQAAARLQGPPPPPPHQPHAPPQPDGRAGQVSDAKPRPVSHRMRACIEAYTRVPPAAEAGAVRAASPESVWEVVPPQGSMRRMHAHALRRGASDRSAGVQSFLHSQPSMHSVGGSSVGSVRAVGVGGMEPRFSFNAPQHPRRRARSPTGSVASIAQSLVAATRLPRSSSRASSGILPGNGSFTEDAIQRSMQDLIQEHKRTGQRMGARLVRQDPLRVRRSAEAVNERHKLLFDHMQDAETWATLTNTQYTRRELIQLFIRFKALCQLSPSPHGIDLDTFRRGTPALSVEDDYFTERVFTVLDKDCSGYITFKEYLQGLHVLQRGSRSELLRFLFAVHDENLDGAVSKQELFRFFLASLRVSVNDNIEQMSVNFVDSVFGMLDKDNNGVIKLEDAQAYLDAHPGQTDVFGLFGRTMSWGNDSAATAASASLLPPIDSGFAPAEINVDEEQAIVRRMNFALTHKARHRVAMTERRAQQGGAGSSSSSRAASAGAYSDRGRNSAYQGHRKYLANSPAHRRRANSVQERVSEVLKATVVNGGDSDEDEGGDAYGATLHVSKVELGTTALKTMMLLGSESEGHHNASELLRR